MLTGAGSNPARATMGILDQQIAELRATGIGSRLIGNKLGISHAHVSKRLKALGLNQPVGCPASDTPGK